MLPIKLQMHLSVLIFVYLRFISGLTRTNSIETKEVVFPTAITSNFFSKLSIVKPSIEAPDLCPSKEIGRFSIPPDNQLTQYELAMKQIIGDSNNIYYSMTPAEKDVFMSLLPPELLNLEVPLFQWQYITGEKSLLPHIDVKRRVAINFYVQVNDEVTKFYNNPSRPAYVFRGSSLYLEEWLTLVSSFKANVNDVVLLDVSAIHGVCQLRSGSVRLSASIGFFSLSYHQVLSILRKHNLTAI